MSKDIISSASNGETKVAEGLAAMRANTDLWNKVVSKCKGTVNTVTSWSFADMVGDVRTLARTELELFEVDAILSAGEEWYYVWSTDKGKITAQDATECTKTVTYKSIFYCA